RVELALLLRREANVLLFDEPTNDLDLPTLQALEAALLEFGGSCIVVTHDRYFLDKVATAILVLEGGPRGAKATRYEGNYEAYRVRRAEDAARAEEEARIVAKKAEPRRAPPPAAAPKRSLAEDRELAEISGKIEQAESVKAALE